MAVSVDRRQADPTLYGARIERVDLRAGLLRECEAMLAYAGSSGIVLGEAVRAKAGILDAGIEQRAGIPMSVLVELHGLLAKAVEPATPRTIDLMRWDSQVRPHLHAIAPVPALRRLLYLALAFLLVFCAVGLSGFVNLDTIASSLLDLDRAVIQGQPLDQHEPWFRFAAKLALLLFYFSLAGIGATFKALYDAYQYVQEGRYDPRLDSTYYIRIGLGLIAGLLLAQVLNDYPPKAEVDATTALGKPVLALVGGFAAQVVYRILSRLVEAVESVFRPEVHRQLQAQERDLKASQRQAEADRNAVLAGRTAAIATELKDETDPARRKALVDELMGAVLPGYATGATTVVASTVTTAAAAVEGMFSKAERWLGLGRTVVDLLPDGRADAAKAFLREAEKAFGEVEAMRRKAAAGDTVGAAKQLVERLVGERNPLTRALRDALGSFGAVLGRGVPGLAAGASPAGLVLGVVAVAAKLGQQAYERWKVRILEAPYRPDLLPPASITFNSVMPALALSPTFRAAFADLLEAPEPPAIVDIGELALADDGQALRARYPDRFPDADAFARGVVEFRQAMLGGVLAPDVPSEAVERAGVASPEALMQALDAVRADPGARADLELVALLGERVRAGAIALEDLEEALAAVEGRTA